MAHNEGKITNLLIENEMKESYLAYAMSVIVSRALPDVRDGLKPSQRRILVAMNDINLGPRSKFRKCAKIVGDTGGNYHPHGDQTIYPTLVRMAQEFNMRVPLAEGQGNFGSIDGDPPAAMRYTESRLTYASNSLLEDLKYDTVDFSPNYDDTREEPSVLPGPFPNLLANGCSGIAVGMATSMPPHNVGEVARALMAMIDNPEMTTSEILEYIKGPDFPTGGIICGRTGFEHAYRSGRGKITVRARVEMEEQTKGTKTHLIVREIPYQVTKTKIIEKMVDLVKNGRITGISDIRDESDRDGMRLVIIPKQGEDPETLLYQLYKHTQLQSTFSMIHIALINGRPKTFTLRELLQAYLDHRFEVITRRTQYFLKRDLKKAHQQEGLLVAYDYIDQIIDIIRASEDVETAKDSLMDFFREEERIKHFLDHRFPALKEHAEKLVELRKEGSNRGVLSESQVEMILRMRLQSLTGLEREKLETSYRELQEQIGEYREILRRDELVYGIIKEDLESIESRFGDERRTQISLEEVGDITMEDLIPEDVYAVTISEEGYIKRVALSTYKQQNRGGKGVIGAQTKEGDYLDQLFVCSSHDHMLFFTDKGQVHSRKVYEIPELGRTAKGRSVANLLELDDDENITTSMTVENFQDDKEVFMVTRQGYVKKTALDQYSNIYSRGIHALRLEDDDLLVNVMLTSGNDDIVIGTHHGQAILFNEQDVRSTGRVTRGVRGIRLRDGDFVQDMVKVNYDNTLLTICENGFGKRTDFTEYRKTKRGALGVINIRTSERNGNVHALHSVDERDELVLISSQGKIIRMPVKDIRVCGRATQGVTLFRLDKKDTLVSSARIDYRDLLEEEDEDGEETEEVVDEDLHPEGEGEESEGDSPDAEDKEE